MFGGPFRRRRLYYGPWYPVRPVYGSRRGCCCCGPLFLLGLLAMLALMSMLIWVIR